MSKPEDKLEDETTIESKRGRGRPRKEGTIGTPPKQATTKKNGYTVEEIQTKLHILLSGLAKILGTDYGYEEEDYRQEAAALVRMSVKFEIVSQAIALFDPVLVVLGLFTKISSVLKRPKKENLDKETSGQQLRNVVNM